MATPKITIGMATYNDFEGVWATVQSAIMHNDWERPTDVELVVIDTSPEGIDHVDMVRSVVVANKSVPLDRLPRGAKTPLGKHIRSPELVGTTAPRDKIFEHATAPYVVVMDCHVMLHHNSLLRLLKWFERNPDNVDLIHGPMIYDDLNTVSTHLGDQFRAGMRGTWGSIWRTPGGTLFVVEGQDVSDTADKREDNPYARCHDLMTLKPWPTDENGAVHFPCGMTLPAKIGWIGNDRVLSSLGCVEVGKMDSEEPIEISGCGMGLFATRRDAWLGFAKHCSGFGGEELNIHDKYRKAGRKALCLPFLRWNHRFGRGGGTPYPHPQDATVRNYVLWSNEIGIPLDRVHTHFVKGGLLPQDAWDKIVADPVGYQVNLAPPPSSADINYSPVDALYTEVVNTPRDLNENAEFIRAVARDSDNVMAIVKRCEWDVLLAAGYPSQLLVLQEETNDLTARTHAAVEQRATRGNRGIKFYQTVPKSEWITQESIGSFNADTLVIDGKNTAEHLQHLLDMFLKPSVRLLMVRGTQAFGVKPEEPNADGTYGKGLWEPIKRLIAERPEWFVAAHRPQQYGVTVLARAPRPKPLLPVFPWPIGFGPGTELKKMLESVGIKSSANCDCNAKMHIMDGWGVAGCRENKEVIVGWLVANAERWGWLSPSGKPLADDGTKKLTTGEKFAIGWRTIRTGIAFHVNWLDPFPGLVDEAIRRAVVAGVPNE